ncbi:hypothetical protein JCM21900_005976 [Sporobolomyces salmonicolor]
MPPFRDPNRLFYDPANPVMLSADEISQLSPSELQAATDQLDQNMVLLLQRIEENFAQCNQLVTERLLPAVEQHGENSARIYESIKFWRPFFEAAASIRLNEPYYDDSTSVATEEAAQGASPDRTVSSEGDETYTTTPSEDGTPRAGKSHPVSVSDIPSEPHWSNDMSPFQSLQQERAMPANSAMKQPPLPDMQRLRLRDLPPDSPDVPEPDFETVNVDAAGSKGKGRSFDLSSDPSSPSFSALRGSPAPRNPKSGGGSNPQSALFEKILRKNLASPLAGPGSSTPGAGARGKLKFPHDLPQNWNGIANLSTTSLDAFPSPIKRRPSAMGEDDSFAPPPTTQHPGGAALTSSPAPRNPLASSTSTLRRYPAPPSTSIASPAFSRTPAKEAARRTAQHVYDALDVDSPLLEPPSALKNPATMVYNPRSTYGGPGPESPSERSTIRRTGATLGGGAGMSSMRSGAPHSSDESYASLPAQPSFANASRTDVYDFSSSGRFGGAGRDDGVPLSDFGGGTTANIDDLLAGHTMTFQPPQPVDYAGIVDDDADHGVHGQGAEDESYTGEEGTEGFGQHGQQQQQQRYDEDESFALDAGLAGRGPDGRFAARLEDGPEDTLFGMPTAKGGGRGGGEGGARPSSRPLSRQLVYEDDSFTDEAAAYGAEPDGNRFRLHGLSDMETLHGGELLASEPFQASPLAGRYGQYGQ